MKRETRNLSIGGKERKNETMTEFEDKGGKRKKNKNKCYIDFL